MRKTLTAIAAGLLLTVTGAHANLVTNGTFDSPDLSTGSFSPVTSLSFSDLNWGFYSGGTGLTKLVDSGGNQFAIVTVMTNKKVTGKASFAQIDGHFCHDANAQTGAYIGFDNV